MRKCSTSSISSCDGGENYNISKPTMVRFEREKVNRRSLHTCKYCPDRQFPSGRALGGHMRTHALSLSPSLPPPCSSSDHAKLIGSSSDHANTTFKGYDRPAESVFLSQMIDNRDEEEQEDASEEEGEDVISVRRSICYDDYGSVGKSKLYTLRQNPKPNMRFIENRFKISTSPIVKNVSGHTSVDSTGENVSDENIHSDRRERTPSLKRDSSTASLLLHSIDLPTPSREVARACSECGRVFPSWKALFGHMRCHPERSWRGIQPPLEDSTSSPSLKKLSRRIQVDSISEDSSEKYILSDRREHTLSLKKHPGQIRVDYENLSDEEMFSNGRVNSINRVGWLEQSTNMSLFLSLSCFPPNVSDDDESDSGSTNKETKKEREEDEFVVYIRRLQSQRVTGKRSRRSWYSDYAVSPLQISDYQEPSQTTDVATTASESSEDWDMANILIMLSKDSSPKYQCGSCKRVFNSHQALGGHRASHRNVKGCFARTNLEGEDVVESAADFLEEEANKEGVRTYGLQSNEEERRPDVPLRKSKAHQCHICNKCFPSGQALGGHMRKHWNRENSQ